ncbi:beta-ketoacyl-[acyl-carrier-protein] synthase family protein [soil metagenome]
MTVRTDDCDEVVVTGVGAVTAHGVGADALWDGVVAARPVARVDDTDHPTGVVTAIDGLSVGDHLPRKLVAQTDRSVQFALIAAREALHDAGVLGDSDALVGADAARAGVVIATGVGPVTSIIDEHERSDGGSGRVRPYLAVTMPVNMAAGRIAQRHRLHGPALVVASACAAGTDALGLALDMIRSGRADLVVAGGAEAPIAPLTLAAFRSAGALSTRVDDPAVASRPFDIDRDGFVLGEGAGVLVLESGRTARARGAPRRGAVLGHAASNDAHHPTQPAPDGRGAVAAVRAALADAGFAADAIGHVNAHATSTQRNDEVEALVLRTVLGEQVGTVPVTATKSTIGHLFGAAGAVEAIVALRSAATGIVPPIANLGRVDPLCADLDLVTARPRPIDRPLALSTSFGFGGHNAALLLRA